MSWTTTWVNATTWAFARVGPRMASLLAALLILLSPPAFASGISAPPATAIWDPLAAPDPQADTTFTAALSSEPAIASSGGMITGSSTDTSASLASQVDFLPGRFGPAVRLHPGGTASCVRWLAGGLMPTDEFTVSFWEKRDTPAWPLSSAMLAITGNNTLEFTSNHGNLYVHAYVPALNVNKAYMVAPGSLADTAWHQIAATLKAGTLTVYTDGVKRGTVTGVSFLPLWTSGTHGTGICLCGTAGHPGDFTISDVQIDRTCRVPGVPIPLRSLDGSLSVDASTVTGQSLPLVAGLHPGSGGVNAAPSPAQASGAFNLLRTDKFLSATPMKAGPADALYPSLGHSGLVSYDWQVVDRDLDYMQAHGVGLFLSVDGTPQLLGGPDPLTGLQLTSRLSNWAAFGVSPPNNLLLWKAIVGDMAYHILVEKQATVLYWGVWNEPTGMFRGTQAQYDALYDAAAQAIRSVDPAAAIGGPEDFTAPGNTYLSQLFAHCQQAGTPLSFLSYHDYTGDLSDLDRSRLLIDSFAGKGFPTIIGETNWSSEALPSGLYQWRNGNWHLRAFDAAFLTSYLIHATQLGGFKAITFTATQYGDPGDLSDSWHEMQLLGPQGQQWAPYNALALWKQTMGGHVLEAQADLAPGTYALSTAKEDGGYGIALSSFGYSQRQSRTIHISLQHTSGSYTVQETLLDSLHSRFDLEGMGPDAAGVDSPSPCWSSNITADGAGSLQFDVTLPANSCAFLRLIPGALPALPDFLNYVDRAGEFDPVAPWAKESFARMPWRGYSLTQRASTLLAGMGVNYNLPANLDPAAACNALAAAGIHSARLEIGWGGVSRDESGYVNSDYLGRVLRAMKAAGIRPLILLNAHHGQPCPFQRTTVHVVSGGAIGSRDLVLDSVGGLVAGQSGLSGLAGETVNKMAAILFTVIDPARRAVTLSQPLPSTIPDGTAVIVDTLKYPPLFPTGTPQFEQTAGGWMRYVGIVGDLIQQAGITDFGVEIWNELGFGSDYILNQGYYNPPIPALHTPYNWLLPGGSCWELGRRTAAALHGRFAGVKVIWGFSNVSAYHTPFALLPVGVDGASYHPYGTSRFTIGQGDFPPAARLQYYIDPPPPAGFTVCLPEGVASGGIQMEGLYHLLAPWGHPAGFEQIFSEHGYYPAGLNLAGDQALRYKAEALLRGYVYWIGMGLGEIDVYAAYSPGDQNMGLLPGDYPAHASSLPLQSLARLSEKMGGISDSDPIVPLSLKFAALGPDRPDGTGVDLKQRLVWMPFQVSSRKYVCPLYCMTWDPAAQIASGHLFDPVDYVLDIQGIPDGAAVSYYDPVTDRSLPATVLRRMPHEVIVQVSAVDYPRLLTVQV